MLLKNIDPREPFKIRLQYPIEDVRHIGIYARRASLIVNDAAMSLELLEQDVVNKIGEVSLNHALIDFFFERGPV